MSQEKLLKTAVKDILEALKAGGVGAASATADEWSFLRDGIYLELESHVSSIIVERIMGKWSDGKWLDHQERVDKRLQAVFDKEHPDKEIKPKKKAKPSI